MNLATATDATPGAHEEAILDALNKVLGSDLFKDVPRLSRFLEFVVKETLAGREDRIKGFVIACEVFDKSDPNDAQTTTIVRVEAGRLRRRLDDYYQTAGSEESLRIAIPKGGYKPTFTQVDIPDHSAQAIAATDRTLAAAISQTAHRSPRIWVTIALLAAVAIGAVMVLLPNSPQESTVSSSLPTLAVLPLEPFNNSQTGDGIAHELTDTLIASLSRQPDLLVMALTSNEYFHSRVDSVRDIARDMKVSHVIKGGFAVTPEGLNMTVALHDALSGYVIWSDEFQVDRRSGAKDVVSRIQRGIQFELGLTQLKETSTLSGFDPDRHALYTQARNLSHPPANKLRVELAMGIFQNLIAAYPEYAGGYAGAAYAESAWVWWGHSESPAEDAKNSRDYAEQALRLDESSGLAYLSLGMLEMASENHNEAIEYMQRAVDVQPSNALALSVLATVKIWSGQPEGAIALIEKALYLDPTNTRSPYLNLLGAAHFHQGNYAESVIAFKRNIQQGGPRAVNHDYYLAAALAATGDTASAMQVLTEVGVTNVNQGWQQWLYRNFKDKAEFDHLMTELAPLGVSRFDE